MNARLPQPQTRATTRRRRRRFHWVKRTPETTTSGVEVHVAMCGEVWPAAKSTFSARSGETAVVCPTCEAIMATVDAARGGDAS